MKIAIPKERRAHEARVAASPETVKKMVGLGCEVVVEKGAGTGADVTDAELVQRVDDRVDDRGRRADRAGLSAALDAERVGGAGGLVGGEVDRRHVVGARHAVVHERA